MNGLPYYKAYPRDFIEGTVGMAFEVKGAYRIVLDLIYMRGGDLPDDQRYIAGVLGCSVRAWKGYRERLIEAGKIVVVDGNIHAGIVEAWAAQARKDETRPPIPASVRADVLSQARCTYCGETSGPFEIDHIFPWARGGTHERENLTLACRPCNRSKCDKTLSEWLQ